MPTFPEPDPITSRAQSLLPLKPVDLQILLVLAEDDLHGYGLMKAVEEESGGQVRLEVGSLYRLISRLLDNELIEETGTAGTAAERRRRLYRITPLGRRVAAAEAERLEQVLEVARRRVVRRGDQA